MVHARLVFLLMSARWPSLWSPYLVQGEPRASGLSGVCWRINDMSKTNEWRGKGPTCQTLSTNIC